MSTATESLRSRGSSRHTGDGPRGSAMNACPFFFLFLLQVGSRSKRKNVEHGRVTLVTHLRRVFELDLGAGAQPRSDRDILFAVDLESHRRRGKARADIDLPQ